jgi:branched-chain amino acid aminotransferase
MHIDCYFDGEIRDAAVEISALSSAALYGKGVFTTVAIYDGEPFVWEKHWRRLVSDAKAVGVEMSGFSEDGVRSAVNEIVRHNGVDDGRMRITFFDNSPGAIWPSGGSETTSLLIITGDKRAETEGLRLGISPYPLNSRSPLAGIKSCNYLENQMARKEGEQRGFDEAIRLNERGEIASACMANVFWLKDERLYTPSLQTGCLAGTTREFVLENLECIEVEAGVETLDQVDAIFLTSAGLGIAQAANFEGKGLRRVNRPIIAAMPGTGR